MDDGPWAPVLRPHEGFGLDGTFPVRIAGYLVGDRVRLLVNGQPRAGRVERVRFMEIHVRLDADLITELLSG